MSNFNLNRFVLVLKKDFEESYKSFLIAVFLIIFLLFFIFAFYGASSTSGNNSNTVSYHSTRDISMIFSLGLIILGIKLAGGSFSALMKKEKGIMYMSLPASNIEKFLSVLLLNIIVFPIVFYIIYSIIGNLYKYFIELIDSHITILYYNEENFNKAFIWYFNLSAIFLLGSLKFNDNPIFKTTLIVIVLLIIIFKTYSEFLINMEKNGIGIVWKEPGRNSSMGLKYVFLSKLIVSQIFSNLFIFIVPPYLWLVGFYKFKEKEI